MRVFAFALLGLTAVSAYDHHDKDAPASVVPAPYESGVVQTINWVVPDNKKDQALQSRIAGAGDRLRFEWNQAEKGVHNVYVLDKCQHTSKHRWNAFKCGRKVHKNKGTQLDVVGEGDEKSAEYLIPEGAKSVCVICTLGNHCASGQHVTVIVPPVHEVDWTGQTDGFDKVVQAQPGAIVRFQYGSNHNIWKMDACPSNSALTSTSFDCMASGSSQQEAVGPFDYVVSENEAGSRLCFYCQKGNNMGHCKYGWNMVVEVAGPGLPPAAMKHQVEWRNGVNDVSRTLTVRRNDIVEFLYKNNHNIWKMDACPEDSAENFDCMAPGTEMAGITSSPYPYDVSSTTEDRLCFYCQRGSAMSHCKYGWYLVVNVEADPSPPNRKKALFKCKKTKDSAICKACGGKIKGGKCKVKGRKFAKVKCSSIKKDKNGDFAHNFCESVGCESNGSVCSGTLGNGL